MINTGQTISEPSQWCQDLSGKEDLVLQTADSRTRTDDQDSAFGVQGVFTTVEGTSTWLRTAQVLDKWKKTDLQFSTYNGLIFDFFKTVVLLKLKRNGNVPVISDGLIMWMVTSMRMGEWDNWKKMRGDQVLRLGMRLRKKRLQSKEICKETQGVWNKRVIRDM